MRNITEYAGKDILKVLVGNKCDLAEKRVRIRYRCSAVKQRFTFVSNVTLHRRYRRTSARLWPRSTTFHTLRSVPKQAPTWRYAVTRSLGAKHALFARSTAQCCQEAFVNIATRIKREVIDALPASEEPVSADKPVGSSKDWNRAIRMRGGSATTDGGSAGKATTSCCGS